jgi:hypothetical protein
MQPMPPVPPTPAPAIDARSRALRTFAQGLIGAAIVAVGPIIAASLGGITWTKEYWIGVGVLCGNAALAAGISYVMRYLKPPPTHR